MKQITDVQEQLRKISENKELSAEQKMNKKSELQEKIQSLNSELRNGSDCFSFHSKGTN